MPVAARDPPPANARIVAPCDDDHATPVERLRTICTACQMSDLCSPCNLRNVGPGGRETVAFGRHTLRTNESLYEQGDTLVCIHVVRSGTLMSSVTHADGRRQVCGFHMAGDVIGLDGLVHGRHATTATALDGARTCALDYAQIVDQIAHDPALQHRIGRLMSMEINRTQKLMMLLGVTTAQERVAAFLLDLSQRFKAQGYSAREFDLRMSRAEIGSFLGLTLETVSRTFSAFRSQGLIEVELRRVRILDLERFSQRFEALLRI